MFSSQTLELFPLGEFVKDEENEDENDYVRRRSSENTWTTETAVLKRTSNKFDKKCNNA